MLEILAVIFLSTTNSKNAKLRGKSGGAAVGYTIGLWIGAEIVGAFIGVALGLELGTYILALVFAVAGGVGAFFIAKRGPVVVPPPLAQPMLQNYGYEQPIGQAPQQGYPTQQPVGVVGQAAPVVLQKPRFCTSCGEPAAEGNFCAKCGKPYAVSGVPVAAPVSTLATPNVSAPYSPSTPPAPLGVFYVFAARGPAFGSDPGGDIELEKAQKLKDGYEPARNMELRLVRPGMWPSFIESSNSGGVVTASFSFEDHGRAIAEYLRGQGIQDVQIENGLRVSSQESLQLTNPMSGLYVVGVPIFL